MTDINTNFDFEAELSKLPPHIQHRVRAGKANVGRPTVYRDDWPDKFMLLRASGQTIAQIAAYFGCCVDSIHHLTHKHPKFSAAYKMGKSTIKAYYDDLRKRIIDGDEECSQSRFLMFESGYKRMFAAGEHKCHIPDLHKQKTDADKLAYLEQQLADQEITAETYNLLINSVKTASEHLKLEQLEQRLNDLEGSHAP
tara:strand:+ start:2646 stop:3236 length:591 start_codon:yes stop_codon:yes gene_type:complete